MTITTLGTLCTFAALDLIAAQNRRREAARARNAAVWAAAIRSARFYLAQARAYRLRREAAQRAV
jgi:hypothetical protein